MTIPIAPSILLRFPMGVQDYESLEVAGKSVKNLMKSKASLEQAYSDLYLSIEYTNQTVNLATDYCNYLLNDVGQKDTIRKPLFDEEGPILAYRFFNCSAAGLDLAEANMKKSSNQRNREKLLEKLLDQEEIEFALMSKQERIRARAYGVFSTFPMNSSADPEQLKQTLEGLMEAADEHMDVDTNNIRVMLQLFLANCRRMGEAIGTNGEMTKKVIQWGKKMIARGITSRRLHPETALLVVKEEEIIRRL